FSEKIFAKVRHRIGLSMIADICSMHILLIGATNLELDAFDQLLSNKSKHKNQVSMAVTGVGLLSTTYSLMRIINKGRPDLILQAGIAGCFHKDQEGSVVVIREEIIADQGVLENNQFRDIFDLGLAQKNEMPFSNGRLPNPYQKLLKYTGLAAVTGISINEISTDTERIGLYQQSFNPFVESMEGAALHYVCIEERIPFLQMRAISNFIGERNKEKWQMKTAFKALHHELEMLIDKLILEDENFFGV
ncbi:MAG TPA: futalosine hydrolase, partial [Puia sp.]|nr:futalosine hydrolase [Puia sp.]